MHYTYNTNTTDDVPDGVLEDVTLFDKINMVYEYNHLQRLTNKIIKKLPKESVENTETIPVVQ